MEQVVSQEGLRVLTQLKHFPQADLMIVGCYCRDDFGRDWFVFDLGIGNNLSFSRSSYIYYELPIL